jgi:hypothetical protein
LETLPEPPVTAEREPVPLGEGIDEAVVMECEHRFDPTGMRIRTASAVLLRA